MHITVILAFVYASCFSPNYYTAKRKGRKYGVISPKLWLFREADDLSARENKLLLEPLSPFSCFYLELYVYPLKVLDFALLCPSSLGLNSDTMAAYVVQPRTLGRSD